MDEITELTPPGLLNLQPMLRVVEILTALMLKQAPGSAMMLKLVRAVGRYTKQTRDNANHNLNMQIRAWVLARPVRRLWVRSVIGEAAVKRWELRYAALPKGRQQKAPSTQAAKPIAVPKSASKPYNWKQFTLVNLSFLEFPTLDLHPPSPINSGPINAGKWSQLRAPRGDKRPEFWGFELAPDYVPPATHLNRDISGSKAEDKPESKSEDKREPKPHPPPEKRAQQQPQNKPPPKPKERPP